MSTAVKYTTEQEAILRNKSIKPRLAVQQLKALGLEKNASQISQWRVNNIVRKDTQKPAKSVPAVKKEAKRIYKFVLFGTEFDFDVPYKKVIIREGVIYVE